ncbi:hypothetical protein [Streptomyces sp. NPDC048361]|uniref:hypothetical protein n=1 Tax=Streptomyces sp. NPDC048361 TaxID=3154720 RepID=UPI0034263FD0
MPEVPELPELPDSDILAGRTILAVKAIRDARGCSLHEAVDLFAQRHAELHPNPEPNPKQEPGREAPRPRVLRFERDGSLVVEEDEGPHGRRHPENR